LVVVAFPFMETVMEIPIDPLVADMVKVLDDGMREDFEERAAIMEFDTGIPRGHAECLALLDVLRRHPEVLTSVITLRIELKGAPQCLLTTDLNYALQQLREIGAIEIGAGNLSKLISEKYSGVAILQPIK
jgi:hypothetical protein